VTGDLQEAQEVLQEAFARAVASAARFVRLDNPETRHPNRLIPTRRRQQRAVRQ
jgi:DNA-directed RNA polymerase specialized sigma24 family protein